MKERSILLTQFTSIYVFYVSLNGVDYFRTQHWPFGIRIGRCVLCEEETGVL
jgi:hypothetical protein